MNARHTTALAVLLGTLLPLAPSGGTLTESGVLTINANGTVSVTGGTYTQGNSVTVNGSLNVSSGTFDATGKNINAGTGSISVSGTGVLNGANIATGVALTISGSSTVTVNDLGPTATATMSGGTLKIGRDMRAASFSATGGANAPVVFAGYGASADEFGYDDYRGIDRKDHSASAYVAANYLLNRKRREIAHLEESGNLAVSVEALPGVSAETLELVCLDNNGNEVKLMPAAPVAPSRPRR